jgi:glycosyltransferase involved in cell wall biosynthesis
MRRPEPIRVAWFIDQFMIGGTELNAIRTLEALDRREFDVTVFHLNADGPLRQRYEALGVRLVHVPISGFLSLRTALQGARTALLLRRMHAQVLHAHDVYTNIFIACWARTLAHCRVIASRRWMFEVPRPALNVLNRWSYRFADRVLANSHSVVELLAKTEHVPMRKVIEIPNFVDEASFSTEPEEQRLRQRRDWGIPEGALVVGVVARLAAVKNHAMLLRACEPLEGVHIVLVGDGPERARLGQLSVVLGMAGRIHFLGALLSKTNIHQYFDISALCSRSEGFPNSLMEALAAGRPVAATRVGGVPDVIEHEVNGLLVASEDINGMRATLLTLKGDVALRARLGAAGREQVRREYSESVVVERLQTLYRELAAAVGARLV